MKTADKLREVKAYWGWSLEDISLKLNVSLNTVKSWFRTKDPRNPNRWVSEKIEAWYELLESEGKI